MNKSVAAETQLRIIGMTCGACVGRVEGALRGVEGVADAVVNLMSESASVVKSDDGPSNEQLLSAVRAVGYDAEVMVGGKQLVDQLGRDDEEREKLRRHRQAMIQAVGLALPIVALQNRDGEPIAVLGNYTLHYVGGGGSNEISADYFGLWAGKMESELAADRNPASTPFVAMLTNGCSGNINNIDVRHRLKQPYPYHQAQKVAQIVANQALQVVSQITYHDWVALHMVEKQIEVKVH